MKSLPVPWLQSLARKLADHPKFLFIGALIYVLSPIDLVPEAFLGPFGLLDDVVVILLPFIVREYVKRLGATPRKPPTPDVVETDQL